MPKTEKLFLALCFVRKNQVKFSLIINLIKRVDHINKLVIQLASILFVSKLT